MSNDKRTSIRVDLTRERQDQVKSTWGQEADAVELNVENLEDRIAPLTLNFPAVQYEYKPQKPDGTGLVSP